jgi:hypothetical protein
MDHESKLHEAIRELASGLASVAGHLGLKHAVANAHAAQGHVAPPPAEPAAVDTSVSGGGDGSVVPEEPAPVTPEASPVEPPAEEHAP